MFFLPERLAVSGPKSRYEANVGALRRLKALQQGGYAPAEVSDADRAILCRYTGWPTQLMNMARSQRPEHWKAGRLNDDLHVLLTKREQQALLTYGPSSFYTPPPIAREIWNGLERLGLKQLERIRALFPGAGIGNMVGAAPVWARRRMEKPVGVEPDPLAAELCRFLYPEVQVIAQEFERIYRLHHGERTLANWFDLAIASVPGGGAVTDPGMTPRSACESLALYFPTRMLELLRPGGVAVLLVPHSVMDGVDAEAVCRTQWACVADLVGAFRLPTDLFVDVGGPSQVTDVLFLVKGQASSRPWIHLENVLLHGHRSEYRQQGISWKGEPVYKETLVPYQDHAAINAMFARDEARVLGIQTLNGKQRPVSQEKRLTKAQAAAEEQRLLRERYTVEPCYGDAPVGRRLQLAILDQLPADVLKAPGAVTRVAEEQRHAPVTTVTFEPRSEGQECWWQVYCAGKALIEAQVRGADDQEFEAARKELHRRYDRAVRDYGRVRDGKARTLFRGHPGILSFLMALENDKGERESLFAGRIIQPESQAVTTTNPVDALYAALDRTGVPDLAWVGQVTGKTQGEVLAGLGDLVFELPSGGWVLAEEYLSGNVRRKLDEAVAAAMLDQRFRRNVQALSAEGVQPRRVQPADISVGLNAKWVPPDVVAEFIRTVVPAYTGEVHHVHGGAAYIMDRPDSAARDSEEATRKWGCSTLDAFDLIQAGLDGRTPRVQVEDNSTGKAKKVEDAEASVVAQVKLSELNAEYQRWLWAEPSRAQRLLDIYNDRFNCWRPRTYRGDYLTFPGMARLVNGKPFDLRPFQRDGVARNIYSDRKSHPIFVWPTGAGKTYGCIAAVEKMLQLGKVDKVVIACPRHLVAQWVDDYRKVFPGRADQILAAGSNDLSPSERGKFLAWVASGGFRVVIMSHQQFKSIPVGDETFEAVVRVQIERLAAEINDLEASDNGDRYTRAVKYLQRQKAELERRIEDRQERARRDASWGLVFEQLGFDMFVGDESQRWKNLQLATRMGRVNGIQTARNQISLDFKVKVRAMTAAGAYLLKATATPIDNSLAEMFVTATYAQDELLKEVGLDNPDAFFGAFTRPYSSVELDPSCSGYRVVTRLEYGNLPELAALARQSWQIVRPSDLNIPIPALVTGQEILVSVPGSEELLAYIKELSHRATLIRAGEVEPDEDNMLKVCSDGRWASITNGNPFTAPPEGRDTKLTRCADKVVEHWRETTAVRGTQLIFCDLGIPKGETGKAREQTEEAELLQEDMAELGAVEEEMTDAERWAQDSVYGTLRRYLVRRGVPSVEIAFARDYKNPDDKRRLYRMVNEGRIRVLIGSTSVMGTGMNVQERLVALHNIDPTWKPGWYTQRLGRILRQGNLHFDEVYVYSYLTEGSFDAYMWGLIKAKLRVIEQVMWGDVTVRSLDGDIGDTMLRASEIQAIASGNPAVLEFVAVQNELLKLTKVWEARARDRRGMIADLKHIPRAIETKQGHLEAHRHSILVRDAHPVKDREFAIDLAATPGGKDVTSFNDRRRAHERLHSLATQVGTSVALHAVGSYRGFRTLIQRWQQGHQIVLEGPNEALYTGKLTDDPVGTFASMNASLDGIEKVVAGIEGEIRAEQVRDRTIRVELRRSWELRTRYVDLLTKYRELAAALGPEGLANGDGEFADLPEESAWVEPPPLRMAVPVVVQEVVPAPVEVKVTAKRRRAAPKEQLGLFD